MSDPTIISVLHIEDSPTDILLTKECLSTSRFQIRNSQRLQEALNLIRTNDFNVVLLDLGLPDSQGLDTLRSLRECSPQVAVVVLIGKDDDLLAEQMLKEGVQDYLVKNQIEAGSLQRAIRNAVSRSESEKLLRRSEKRFRTLVAATASIVWSIPASGVFESEQPGWTAFTGQTFEQLRGWGWLNAVHPEDRENTTAVWNIAVATRHVYQAEYRLRRADGEYRCTVVRAAPLLDSNGDIREWIGVHIDITEQRKAEAERNELLKILQLRVERMPLAYLLSDSQNRFTHWNPAAERTFGFVEAEVLGKHPLETIVPPQSVDIVTNIFAQLAAGDMNANETCENITKDGRTIICEWYNTPLFREDGAFDGVLSLAHDITNRKRVEQTLGISEARYRRLFEAAQDGILIVDPATRKVFDVNPFLLNLVGYAREEMIGKELWEIGLFRDITSSKEAFEILQATGYIRYDDLALLAKSGRRIDVEFVSNVYDVGGINVIQCNIRDISGRKKTETELLLRDRAIQAATQGLMITDACQPDNPVIYVSPAMEKMTGYSREDFMGKNCRFLQGKASDRIAATQIREAVRLGRACTVEILNYRKDGSTFWNELAISPVRDDSGKLTNFVGVQADVTARKSLEEQFRQVQKMEAVGQLAGGIAHDFNNLLTVINGYCDVLLQTLPPSDPSHELILEIFKAGERSAMLTRQLLAFSRQQVLAPRMLDLNEVVVDTEKMLRRLVGEDIRLTTTLEPKLWMVQADPGQLEQVLMNLAVNARDAMPLGGFLTIETRKVELDEGYVQTHVDARIGPHVLMSVADTGTGIRPELMARIFEPFFTTKSKGQGTGLGLATVYGIVRQSGGHIGIYSEVGIGTTFKIYLPRSDRDAGGSKLEAKLDQLPLARGKETILLVEDEEGLRGLARRVLIGHGYSVLDAFDGVEAIRVLNQNVGPIDLLITDVVMPGLGGRAVADKVVERHPGVRVLYISGYTDDAVIRHGVLREGVNFLQKPFSPTALALKVREVLDAPSSLKPGESA